MMKYIFSLADFTAFKSQAFRSRSGVCFLVLWCISTSGYAQELIPSPSAITELENFFAQESESLLVPEDPEQESLSQELEADLLEQSYATEYSADHRAKLNKQVHLGISNLLFWGVAVGYYPAPNFFLGLGGYSTNFFRTAFGLSYSSSYSQKVRRLNTEGHVSIKWDMPIALSFYEIVGRYYPFETSGFFLQPGLIYQDWDLNAKLKVKDYSKYQSLIYSEEIANVYLRFPNTSWSLKFGWSWINTFGFSATVGMGAVFGGLPEVKVETGQLRDGNDIATQDEIDEAKKVIRDRLRFVQFQPELFISFGRNF